MATTTEHLVAILETRGASKSEADIKRVQNAVDRTSKSFTMMGVAAAAVGFASQAQEILGLVGAITGVTRAAEFERAENAFTVLLKDAGKAKQLFSEIKALGNIIPVDTTELLQMAQGMAATGFATDTLAKHLQTMALTTRILGGDAGSFTRMVSTIRQLLGSPTPQREEFERLVELGIPIDRLVNSATGKNFQTGRQAEQYLQGLGGKKAVDILLKGMEKEFASSPVGGFLKETAELFNRLKNVMEPTGKALLPLITGLLKMANFLLSIAEWLNKITSGGVGLAALTAGFLVLMVVGKTTITTLYGLALALNMVAASAIRATAASGGLAASNAIAGASPLMIAGAGGRVAGAAGLLRLLGPLGLAFGASWLGGQIAGDRKDKTKSYYGDLLGNVGVGAGVGAAIGSIFPVVGTIAGGVIGATLGAFKSLYEGFGGETQLSEQKKTNAILKNIESKLIGGGDRTRSVTSQIEMEMALAKALMLGVG